MKYLIGGTGVLFGTILAITLFMTGTSDLEAKCYSFSSGGGWKACVHGDSFSDRKKAQKLCKAKKGSSCGNVRSSSSSCHSNSGKCIDHHGKATRSLRGY